MDEAIIEGLKNGSLVRATGANLCMADFEGAELQGIELTDCDLRGARFRGADLRGARLRHCSMRMARFEGADLRGADLSKSIVRMVNLNNANLGCADLGAADLGGSLVEGADFFGARFSATVLGRLDLSQAKNLDNANHAGPSSIGVDTIVMSRGTIPDVFLRGCGVPDYLIAAFRDLIPK